MSSNKFVAIKLENGTESALQFSQICILLKNALYSYCVILEEFQFIFSLKINAFWVGLGQGVLEWVSLWVKLTTSGPRGKGNNKIA